MYEETKEELLPKYFKDLHLEVAAITGSPRIAKRKIDENGFPFSDTYKNISKEEWESAILNWAKFLPNGYVQVLKDYTFVIAGKAHDKKSFIMGLRKLADDLEEMINNEIKKNIEVIPNEQ